MGKNQTVEFEDWQILEAAAQVCDRIYRESSMRLCEHDARMNHNAERTRDMIRAFAWGLTPPEELARMTRDRRHG